MSTDLNGLGLLLLLDDKVPIPVIESSMEPGFLGMITEGLTRSEFNKAPEPMGSLDAAKALQGIKTAGQVRLHVLCDFHPYLKHKDDLIDIRYPMAVLKSRHSRDQLMVSRHGRKKSPAQAADNR